MRGKRHLKQREHAAHLAEALCRPGEENTATPHCSAEQATGAPGGQRSLDVLPAGSRPNSQQLFPKPGGQWTPTPSETGQAST